MVAAYYCRDLEDGTHDGNLAMTMVRFIQFRYCYFFSLQQSFHCWLEIGQDSKKKQKKKAEKNNFKE